MNYSIDLLPQEFLEMLRKLVPEESLTDVEQSFCYPKPSTFRVNTIKNSYEKLKEELKRRQIEYEEVSFLPGAFILKGIPQKEFTATDLYKNGYVYIQSISSMIPPLVLNPQENEKVLDITAAPGSKTTQMAALMNNTGEIVANDNSRVRMYKLEANIMTQGVTNTTLLYKDAREVWKIYPEYFDKTLVDVPCSLEGRFLCTYEKSYKDWSPKKVKVLSQIQKFILRSAVSATKPGGTIVYSTCTLSPEENEEVVNWILQKEKGKLVLEKISFVIPDMLDGVPMWNGRTYSSDISKTKRILPTRLLEGFYVAKFKKTSSTLPSSFSI